MRNAFATHEWVRQRSTKSGVRHHREESGVRHRGDKSGVRHHREESGVRHRGDKSGVRHLGEEIGKPDRTGGRSVFILAFVLYGPLLISGAPILLYPGRLSAPRSVEGLTQESSCYTLTCTHTHIQPQTQPHTRIICMCVQVLRCDKR